MDPVRCILMLGTNRGDRLQMLEKARLAIESGAGRILKGSPVYESEPWGFSDPEYFLNQALEIETRLDPEQLLNKVLEIEKELGRVRNGKGYSGRTIDIDILFYGDRVVNTPDLQIPHPRLHERRFVLIPVADLDAGLVHPVLDQTIGQLLVNCRDNGRVSLLKLS